jgi:hypothetical protein
MNVQIKRLAFDACMDIRRRYPQKMEDLLTAVHELVLGDEHSLFCSTLLTGDLVALWKLCNGALDRVRIRNARRRKRAYEEVVSGRARVHGHTSADPLAELMQEETEEETGEWASELERPYIEHLEEQHFKYDAEKWICTLRPIERAALALMMTHWDPWHPRSAQHYSDRDIYVALTARFKGRVCSRPRIAELRAELLRLLDLWITLAPEVIEEQPTHYTEDMKPRDSLELAPDGSHTVWRATETALPGEKRPKNYSPYEGANGPEELDQLTGPGSALVNAYRDLDRSMQRARGPASAADLAEAREAAAAVDVRVGSTTGGARLDRAGYAELTRLQGERLRRRSGFGGLISDALPDTERVTVAPAANDEPPESSGEPA